MRQKRADIDAIIAQTAPPDFTNTVLALEKSGAMLSRVNSVFFAMTSAHTNDYLQELDEAFSTELAGLANDIWLNETSFPASRPSGRKGQRWMPNPADWWKKPISTLCWRVRD
jgi:Zn-dependent oligopeptidase